LAATIYGGRLKAGAMAMNLGKVSIFPYGDTPLQAIGGYGLSRPDIVLQLPNGVSFVWEIKPESYQGGRGRKQLDRYLSNLPNSQAGFRIINEPETYEFPVAGPNATITYYQDHEEGMIWYRIDNGDPQKQPVTNPNFAFRWDADVKRKVQEASVLAAIGAVLLRIVVVLGALNG